MKRYVPLFEHYANSMTDDNMRPLCAFMLANGGYAALDDKLGKNMHVRDDSVSVTIDGYEFGVSDDAAAQFGFGGSFTMYCTISADVSVVYTDATYEHPGDIEEKWSDTDIYDIVLVFDGDEDNPVEYGGTVTIEE